MYYIYKIENIINKKVYVGLTNNWKRRKARHFLDLKNNEHDNPHLQEAYNKYGKENFVFSIIGEFDCTKDEIKDYESYYIKELKAYPDGYNCNPGGKQSYFLGQLSKEQVFEICSILERVNRRGQIIADYYGVSLKVISNIRTEKSYNNYIDEYKKLEQSEKEKIFNFIKDKIDLNLNYQKKRKLSKKQVFMLYIQRDYKTPILLKELMEDFDIKNYNVVHSIRREETYKDYSKEYKTLNLQQKNDIAYHYTVMYKRKPFELLETPTK